MGLSNLAWELCGLLSAFLFLTSLVPFFGTLLLLASSSLMSSPSTDGLMLRFPSTLSFPPPAVRLCCFLLWGYWPLSCMKEHAEDCGATLNITQVDRYEQRAEKWIAKNPEQQHTHTKEYWLYDQSLRGHWCTFDSQAGQNQSPSGTVLILGLWQ